MNCCLFFVSRDGSGRLLLEKRGNFLGFPCVFSDTHEIFDNLPKGVELFMELRDFEFKKKSVVAWILKVTDIRALSKVELGNVSYGFDISRYELDVFARVFLRNTPRRPEKISQMALPIAA